MTTAHQEKHLMGLIPSSVRRRVRSPRPEWSGFTLIELLLVVALIALLIGLLFPALKATLTRVERSRATTEARQIADALIQFNSDVGAWPLHDWYPKYISDSNWKQASDTNYYVAVSVMTAPQAAEICREVRDMPFILVSMYDFLSKSENPRPDGGTRSQLFIRDKVNRPYLSFETNRFKVLVNPLTGTRTNHYLVDSWNNVYWVRFDFNNDGKIPNPFEASTTKTVRASVLLWSPGPDGTNDLNGENSPVNRDNIKSW